MSANPNLLPVSAITDADKKVEHDIYWAGERGIGIPGEIAARHRQAAEQSKDAAFVAMLEGMKVKLRTSGEDIDCPRNAVIDEAIANAKAMRRAG